VDLPRVLCGRQRPCGPFLAASAWRFADALLAFAIPFDASGALAFAPPSAGPHPGSRVPAQPVLPAIRPDELGSRWRLLPAPGPARPGHAAVRLVPRSGGGAAPARFRASARREPGQSPARAALADRLPDAVVTGKTRRPWTPIRLPVPPAG